MFSKQTLECLKPYPFLLEKSYSKENRYYIMTVKDKVIPGHIIKVYGGMQA
jgi:hypothetical protein